MASSLTSREGQRIPSARFLTRVEGQMKELTTNDVFGGKKVAAFGLPGAFTPTCTTSHVPRFNELADTFKANGIDDIVCIAVNDPFTLEAWQKERHAFNIKFLADPNGEFAEKMGLLVDLSDKGLGKRSWRYSMLVEDGVIKKQFIEPKDPGVCEMSYADTLLRYINPDARLPDYVTLITKPTCEYSEKARKMLQARKLPFEDIVIGQCGISSGVLHSMADAHSTPQCWINGKLIGGSDKLEEYLNSAEFKRGRTISEVKSK